MQCAHSISLTLSNALKDVPNIAADVLSIVILSFYKIIIYIFYNLCLYSSSSANHYLPIPVSHVGSLIIASVRVHYELATIQN